MVVLSTGTAATNGWYGWMTESRRVGQGLLQAFGYSVMTGATSGRADMRTYLAG